MSADDVGALRHPLLQLQQISYVTGERFVDIDALAGLDERFDPFAMQVPVTALNKDHIHQRNHVGQRGDGCGDVVLGRELQGIAWRAHAAAVPAGDDGDIIPLLQNW